MVEVGVYENPWLYEGNISLLTILMISSVSSTALQIIRMVDNTSVENISGSLERPRGKNEK